MKSKQAENESGIDESKDSSQPVRVTESEHGVRGTTSPSLHASVVAVHRQRLGTLKQGIKVVELVIAGAVSFIWRTVCNLFFHFIARMPLHQWGYWRRR